MSLVVHFGDGQSDRIRLESHEGHLNLPPVHVAMQDPNDRPVLLHRVQVTLSGQEAGAVLLGSAYGGDAPLAVLDPAELLLEDLVFEPYAIQLADQTLPPDRYTLRAEVQCQSPPAFEGARPGRMVTVTAEVLLDVGANLERECSVSASWKQRELVVGAGGRAAELSIVAHGLPDDAFLNVTLKDPERVSSPVLADALSRSLQHCPPSRVVDHSDGTVFQQTIEVDLSGAEHREAIQFEPQLIPLRVSAVRGQSDEGGDIRQRELAVSLLDAPDESLVLDFAENVFRGYPVLDIGTSSTFAVLHYTQMRARFLPVEQEETYRRNLLTLLSRRDGVFETQPWQDLLRETYRELNRSPLPPDADGAESLLEYLRQHRPTDSRGTDEGIHKLLRALESAAANVRDRQLRLAVRHALTDLHESAFKTFPLQHQRLISVELDQNRLAENASRGRMGSARPIPSITEITGTDPLHLTIGRDADDNRKGVLASDPSRIDLRFHSSPKDYYALLGLTGKSIPVTSGGQVRHVTPREFLVSTIRVLRKSIEAYRDASDIMPNKRFDQIVLPFPTSSPMSVRRELVEIAKEAGFDHPYVDLDEALSAVVFYLVNPFGDDKEMGLDAYRCSCRPVLPRPGTPAREWLQNILLIDVGGGTTDVALVEVRLTDRTPDTQDGMTGHYYRLTPKLLGATGRPQLAGNLLTLGLFHSLKKTIADAVLTALASNPGNDAPASETPEEEAVSRLQDIAGSIPSGLRNEDGMYRPGSLLDHYPSHELWKDESDEGSQAFELANRVLPTIWVKPPTTDQDAEKAQASASRRFHELWILAEAGKVESFGAEQNHMVVSEDALADLLDVSPDTVRALGIPSVTLGLASFLQAVNPPLEEITGLALDMTRDRLRCDDAIGTDPDYETRQTPILDRIILTGQTCRLSQTREVIVERFQEASQGDSPAFRWDTSQLTCEVEHAKQAAAIGAAYARIRYDRRVEPDEQKKLTTNHLDPYINNLFFFLQCGFRIRDESRADGGPVVLHLGMEFSEFDSDGVGHLRSEWNIPLSTRVSVDRFDFRSDAGTPWGEFDPDKVAKEAGIPFEQFQGEVKCAIETDHRLIVSALFCNGPERHYALPEGQTLNLVEATREITGQAGTDDPRQDTDWLEALSGWVVEVNAEGADPMTLFRIAPDEFDRTFRFEAADKPGQVGGAVSEDFPKRPANGRDRFSIRPVDGRCASMEIGEIERPTNPMGQRVSVRAILDQRGQLRVHMGNLPYWMTEEARGLNDEGAVLRRPLSSPETPPNDLRNPFCGRH